MEGRARTPRTTSDPSQVIAKCVSKLTSYSKNVHDHYTISATASSRYHVGGHSADDQE